MCTRLTAVAGRSLDDDRCLAILARFGNNADRSAFINTQRSGDWTPASAAPEKQTTAIEGDWLARSEPVPSGYLATRSNGRQAYQIKMPHATAAIEAGRRQLPILLDNDQKRQVGVVEINRVGEASARFSQSTEGRTAEAQFVESSEGLSVAFLKRGNSAPVPAAVSLQTVNVGRNSGEITMSDAAEMLALGERHHRADLAHTAIRDGKTIDQFRNELLELLGQDRPLDSYWPDQTPRNFSLTRLIHAEVTNDWSNAGFEREMCQEARRNYAGKARGLVVPAMAIVGRASMTMGGTAVGTVGEVLMGDAYIDALRPASAVLAAGATMFTGLGSNVAIPKNTGDVTAAWVAEGGAIGESDIDVATIDLTPKMIAGRASFTRHLLATSTPQIDELVKRGLIAQITSAIDKAALEGSGTAPVPRGVANTSGVNALTAAGATLTWAEALEAMADVAAANLDSSMGTWIMHPLDAAKIAKTSVDAGSGRFVLENGTIAGRRVIESAQATEGSVYFGVWQHAYIGMWQGLDLVIDPYTNASTGIVNIVASQLADVAVAHPTAFTVVTLGA